MSRKVAIGVGGAVAWIVTTFFFANLTHTAPIAHDGYEVCVLEFTACAFAIVCFIGIPALVGTWMGSTK